MCCRMRSRPISTRRWIWAQRRCRGPLRRRHATRRFHNCDLFHRCAAAIASSVAACVELEPLGRSSAREEKIMKDADKVVCLVAAVLLLSTLSSAPAKAQLGGFGGGGGGEDMMTQMAPMLEMMKAKMGKRRFAMLMQTMGPMMSQMMEGGGFGGMTGGGFGGLAGSSGFGG